MGIKRTAPRDWSRPGTIRRPQPNAFQTVSATAAAAAATARRQSRCHSDPPFPAYDRGDGVVTCRLDADSGVLLTVVVFNTLYTLTVYRPLGLVSFFFSFPEINIIINKMKYLFLNFFFLAYQLSLFWLVKVCTRCTKCWFSSRGCTLFRNVSIFRILNTAPPSPPPVAAPSIFYIESPIYAYIPPNDSDPVFTYFLLIRIPIFTYANLSLDPRPTRLYIFFVANHVVKMRRFALCPLPSAP